MEYDPKTPQYLTSDKTSFAHVSAFDRWPVILTGAIDDLHKSVGNVDDDDKRKEGKKIVSDLGMLKYEAQHDRQMTPIPDDGEPDVAEYNHELEQRGYPSWHDVPWLFSECYLYRRMNTLFSLSKHWKGYDVFARQKMSTFKSSRPAVLELADRYQDLARKTEADKKGEGEVNKSTIEIEQAEKLVFSEMCEICLWGNATDLSLLTSLTYEDIQKLQGSQARKASQKNIIVNDLDEAFNVLCKARRERKDSNRRVDIVLDNSGFELFVDLILAGYLLSSGLATTVVLHPKAIPWFVSDALPKDLDDLLHALSDPQAFYTAPDESGAQYTPLSEKEVDEVRFLFHQWTGFLRDGKLVMQPNRFWTAAGSYWRMPSTAPDLFNGLKESQLVLFKGDLNYRKLTSDAAWDTTTPFTTAIGPFGPKSDVRTLAFRTCKADVVVGLPPGKDEELRHTPNGGGDSGARKWAWSGKWAVISFCDGKA